MNREEMLKRTKEELADMLESKEQELQRLKDRELKRKEAERND